ncbi:zinc finger protein-domain-containing protein [Aspergillus avenaceus]|uniref:Zinc finger protein-domain-containing protein n=1 Tax=Aspergillus avenaceus TaxID=36643 RepID=A0A5N6U467_ASPAV|nr:zinc finger protein-domain-containing protein [Aspergillus avenaceus]
MTSRRENQGTDTSWTSSLQDAMEQNLCLEERLEKEQLNTPQSLLKRLLSTRSVVSTSSSFAESQQAAVGCKSSFREIGTGSIGKVFEQAGTLWAFKVLLIDRSDKLWNNYLMHLRIQDSFDRLGNGSGGLEVPRAAWFANKESEFWSENLHLFPEDPTFPRHPRQILCMERIFPLPQPVRHALIELFCNPKNVAAAKNDASNKDCLVRMFLGRKRYGASRPGGSRFFSLRNYKLHVDQIEELQLDADEYAASMADAFAIMHWHTRIDGMDVEFVLGSTPFDHNSARRPPPLQDILRLTPGTSTFERTTNTTPNFRKRIVSLWMLDFDACSPITMNTAGVNQAIKAFLENDPYCPRPHTKDAFSERLWRIFSQRYLDTGRRITAGSPSQTLPQQFIQGIVTKLSPPDQTSLNQATGAVSGLGASAGNRGSALPQQGQSTRNPSRRDQGKHEGGRGSTDGSPKRAPGNRGQGRGQRRGRH